VDEGRKRVIGIIAGILVAKHMDVADDLFGGPQGSPRTDKLTTKLPGSCIVPPAVRGSGGQDGYDGTGRGAHV
jgi:hypothetical protein